MENRANLLNFTYINSELHPVSQSAGNVEGSYNRADKSRKKTSESAAVNKELNGSTLQNDVESGYENDQRRYESINEVASDQNSQSPKEISQTQGGITNPGFVSDVPSTKKENGPHVALEMTPRENTTELNSCCIVTQETEESLTIPLLCSGCSRYINKVRTSLSKKWKQHRVLLRRLVLVVLAALYLAYFAYAMYFRFGDEDSILLLVLTSATVAGLLISAAKNRYWKKIRTRLGPFNKKTARYGPAINWIVVILILVSIFIFILVDILVISQNSYNLVSASGILVYVMVFFIFSKHPAKVRWQTIFWGFALQLIFAICILKTDAGYRVFEWLGERVTDFFSFSDEGSKFVFGETTYLDHFFVFKVMPTVVFFSATVSVLYHLGVMQVVITKVAWVMQVTMGTTAGESLTAAANIFIGQTEAPLLIGPLLPDMTSSELHAVMTGGFATITGGIMAAYILLGVPANHLISASVMSAPAALAMSKLIYPETEESKTTVRHLKTALQTRSDNNVIGALSSGASASISLVANVVVNLIAFIACLYFLNAILTWFGGRVGLEELTLQLICSYVLWPFAFIMGVEFQDCRKVAQLIGIKTILNEFIAYKDLGGFIANRKLFDAHVINNGSWYFVQDAIHLINETAAGNGTVVLAEGILSDRSIAITTYALCGFSNFGSMGIVLGGLTSMAPNRKPELSSGVFTAMIAGNVACFITACIAGLFYS